MNHQTYITMKYIFFPFAAMALSFVLLTCTLEQEPAIPTGGTNFEDPQTFDVIEVIPDSAGGFFVQAVMDTIELNVDRYGWIWSKNPCPDLDNNMGMTEEINTDSTFGGLFEFQDTLNEGFEKGQVYYFRPYVIAKNDSVFYGKSECTCSFLGVDFALYTDTFNITSEPEVFDGADVRFENRTPNPDNFDYQWYVGNDIIVPDPVTGLKNLFYNISVETTKIVSLTATSKGNTKCKVTKTRILKIGENPLKDYFVEFESGPPYQFWMGRDTSVVDCPSCSGDIPFHPVELTKKFMIGRSEITQNMWKLVLRSSGNVNVVEDPSANKDCGECPVEQVSYDDILTFLSFLSKKSGRRYLLPTEAEWEFAARGNENNLFSGSNTLSEVGWFKENSSSTQTLTKSLSEKEDNKFGLYNMSGNVSEWCSNRYYVYEYDSTTTAVNPPSDQMEFAPSSYTIRGGSFGDDSIKCSIFFRTGRGLNERSRFIGFRIIFRFE
jgi:formylglycine-generating enzyme required for sulfatase activity